MKYKQIIIKEDKKNNKLDFCDECNKPIKELHKSKYVKGSYCSIDCYVINLRKTFNDQVQNH